MPYTAISLGGVAFGCVIIIAAVLRWWFKEGHAPAALVPFVISWLYGMLAALATYNAVSVLGLFTWLTIWAGNLAGSASLVWGVGGVDRNVTRATPIVLEDGGYVIVLFFTAVIVCLWLWAKRIPRGKLAAGAASGALLALSGTVAGVAAIPLGSAVNAAGAVFTEYMG